MTVGAFQLFKLPVLFSEIELFCLHSGAKPQGLTFGVVCQQKFQICRAVEAFYLVSRKQRWHFENTKEKK